MNPTLSQLFAVFILFISVMDFTSTSPIRSSMKKLQIYNQINPARFPTYKNLNPITSKSTIPEQTPTSVLYRENRESDTYEFEPNTKDEMSKLDPNITPNPLKGDNINTKCLTKFVPVINTNRLPSFYYKAVVETKCDSGELYEIKSNFIFLEKTSEDKRFKLAVEKVTTGCVCGLPLGMAVPQLGPSNPNSQTA